MSYGVRWAAAALAAGIAALGAASAIERPNVILIVSDDHGFPDYGFMGSDAVRTPNLDRMASEGLLYPRGYVTTALCSPSLATLLTGHRPHRNGITGNDLSPVTYPEGGMTATAEGRRPLVDRLLSNPLLPKMLSDAGYRTLQTGKLWNVGYAEVGFTDGMTSPGGRHGGEGLSIGRDGMAPVFDFITSARSERRPFFVWYAPFLPHTPHNPPERLLRQYRGTGPTPQAETYHAMVEWLDETCGELDSFLAANGLKDNTVVVFIADNGWAAAEGDAHNRAKRSPYELGVRTPIFVRWPAGVKPLRDEETLASIVDIVPTILSVCGLPVPKDLPGLSLLDRPAMTARQAVYLENYGHDIVDLAKPELSLTSRGIIEGWWKLMVATPYAERVPGRKNLLESPLELYNLKKDPLETFNLAEEDPARVRQLKATLDAWWNP